MNKIGIVLVAVLFFASFLLAIGASTSGGGFTSFIKLDFLSGGSNETRVGGGEQPAGSFGNSTSLLCGRLGVLEVLACGAGNVTPSGFNCTGLIDVYEDYAVTAEGLNEFSLLPVDLEGVLYSPAGLSWLDYALVFGVLLVLAFVLWSRNNGGKPPTKPGR